MEHRGFPTVAELGIERVPVLSVSGVGAGDGEHKPTTITDTSGHGPVIVGRNEDAQSVLDHYRIAELGLEWKTWLGNESLQDAFALLVAGPQCFVQKHYTCAADECIESACEMFTMSDVDKVLPEEPA